MILNEKKYIFNSVLLSLIVFFLGIVPNSLSIFAYIFLSLVILFRYQYSPVVLVLLCFLVLANDSLFLTVAEFGFFKYFIIFIFFIKGLLIKRANFLSNKVFFKFQLIFILIFIHSLFFSPYVGFSVLKLLSWYIFITSLILYFYNLNNFNKIIVFKGVTSSLLTGVLISTPLLFIPEIGMVVNNSGFQGITNQPQVFGTIAGLSAIASLIFFLKKNNYIFLILFLFSLFLIYTSQSRTAGLAFVIAFTCLLFNVFYNNFFSKKDFFTKKSFLYCLLLVLLSPFLLLNFNEEIMAYINKREDAGLTTVSESSRGALIAEMTANINNYWAQGIGFGIPSDFDFSQAIYLPILDLPISLPVEKGVFYIALIEEMGFLFGIIISIFLFLILFNKFTSNFYSPLILFVLGTNLAENTFFSIGGLGMLLWVFICLSIYLKGEYKVQI